MKSLVCILCLFISRPGYAQLVQRLDNSSVSAEKLTSEISRLCREARVTGVVVAVFNNNKPVYEKAFGYANFQTRQPLRLSTEFYGASLSKAVFAELVMKYVEDGKLDLDKPLQSYLPKPIYEYAPDSERSWWQDYSSLRNDTLFQYITARMCLSHTSGFPNWRFFEPDQKLRVKRRPGTRYEYSGEGMVYLQKVMEIMFNMPLDSMAHRVLFRPLAMETSSYTWQPRFENEYSLGHDTSQNTYPRDKDNGARAPSTLETTPGDYIRFMTAVMNNTIVSKNTHRKMFTPQVRIRSKSQFGPLSNADASDNDNIQLSYGLGWGLYKTPYGWGAFKEGHGDGFQHYSVIFPEKKMGILIMSNSDNAESIYKELLDTAIKDVYMPWRWENYIPYNLRN